MKHLIEFEEWEIYDWRDDNCSYEKNTALIINGEHITSYADDLQPLFLSVILSALGLDFEIKIKNLEEEK